MSIFEKLIPSKRREAAEKDREIIGLEGHLRSLEGSEAGLLRENIPGNNVKERAVVKELIRRLKYGESIVGNRELEELDADYNQSKLLKKIKELEQRIGTARDEQERRTLGRQLSSVKEKLRINLGQAIGGI